MYDKPGVRGLPSAGRGRHRGYRGRRRPRGVAMAWGRHAPHTVETERVGGEGRSVADTERLGVGPDIDDRPAHAWEVDEAESWEPVAPDTWGPPADAGSEAEAGPEAEAT